MTEPKPRDNQRQSFLGSIESGVYNIGNDRLDMAVLKAELELGDRIVISGAAEANPRLGKVAGQPILATLELIGSASREKSKQNRWLHLVKIREPSRADLREIEQAAHDKGFTTADYFLASGSGSSIEAIAFLPRGTQYGLVGQESNLSWISYTSQGDIVSPINSAHELVFTLTDDDEIINSLPVKETERRSTKVMVKTTATEAHHQVIEAMLANPAEMEARRPKTLGQALLGIVKK